MKKIPATSKQEPKRTTAKPKKRSEANQPTNQPAGHTVDQPTLSSIQNQVGNAAVQRLLAQRSDGDGAVDLDDATASRINSAHGGGQALDGAVQTQMSQSMGTEFSNVRVHTGSESHELNEQLGQGIYH